MFLIDNYFYLKDLKAYQEDSIHNPIWKSFLDKWSKVEDIVQPGGSSLNSGSIQRYIF